MFCTSVGAGTCPSWCLPGPQLRKQVDVGEVDTLQLVEDGRIQSSLASISMSNPLMGVVNVNQGAFQVSEAF